MRLKKSSILLLLFVFGAGLVSNAVAQAPGISVTAKQTNGNWRLAIGFNKPTKCDDIIDASLFSFPPTQLVPLPHPVQSQIAKGICVIDLNFPLNFISKDNPGGKNYKLLLSFTVDNKSELAEGILNEVKPTVAEDANQLKKGVAKKSEDADFHIDGSLEGARGSKPAYTIDTAVQYFLPPVAGDTSVFRHLRHGPFFSLNASTDPKADPDQMEFGWNFRFIRSRSNGIPQGYIDIKPKIESERDFGNTNFITEMRWTILPQAWPKKIRNADDTLKKWKLFPELFIGAEVGRNLKSPLPAAKGDGVFRALAGGGLRFKYFFKDDSGRSFEWSADYIRRWLFSDELGFKTDDDDQLQLVRFGKSPRDFVETKITIGVNKFFGIFGSYSWGQVPPSFKLVDHKFKLGFSYKFNFTKK